MRQCDAQCLQGDRCWHYHPCCLARRGKWGIMEVSDYTDFQHHFSISPVPTCQSSTKICIIFRCKTYNVSWQWLMFNCLCYNSCKPVTLPIIFYNYHSYSYITSSQYNERCICRGGAFINYFSFQSSKWYITAELSLPNHLIFQNN